MDRRNFLQNSTAFGMWSGLKGLGGEDESEDLIQGHDVRYRDGLSEAWKLDFAAPRSSATPIPAVMLIHGGGWIAGDKAGFQFLRVKLANLGFFSASINYRLASEAPYPAAIEDCKCAMRWIRAHAQHFNVDKDRIGVLGNSAGGHLALLIGLSPEVKAFDGDGPFQNESSGAQCVVSDSGPTILKASALPDIQKPLSSFLAGPPEELAKKIYDGSPINHITVDAPPLLLIYGTADTQVLAGPVDEFVEKTWNVGLKDVTYLRIGMAGHCPYRIQAIDYLQDIVPEFLVRHLMNPGKVA